MKQISLDEEYAKDTGITPQDIAELRQWLQTQPHLPEKYITDLDLILAYHCCHNSSGLTKQVLDLNLTLRTLFHNIFKDRYNERIEKLMSNLLLTPLSMRTKEGYVILYTRLLNSDPKIFHFGDAVKAVLMVIELYQYEQGTWPGMLLTVDFKGVSLAHFAKIDLFSLQHFLYYLQEAILLRLKGMHFLNAPPFIDKLLVMMKPFMKKELMDMLHIHTADSKNLKDYLPVEALPNDSGGNAESNDKHKDMVLAKLRDYKPYFEEESHKRVTESLRPGKQKTISDIFGGVEGSFKKLEID
ncbi:alpha-tocopherol transfer protein-like [Vanessa cardui]|uniref:alpha-tocopherol transfer protein-like n=1 Tax=Vanessa cardui TaxID=171605 RepID=UPI001F12D7F8|nr:alpha-tocopherol transfer protein-like [Vanessa cardui]